MTRFIPNERSYVGFATTIANIQAPTAAEIAAAVDLTGFCVSINASAQGNTVPTPALDSLFETSILGTSQASFTADFYRDDAADTAWTTLPRAEEGFFIISRVGSSGTGHVPVATDKVEVWPVIVTSRQAGAMSSNTVQTFTMNASVPVVPAEDAVVAA
jgi:hypothetical protein